MYQSRLEKSVVMTNCIFGRLSHRDYDYHGLPLLWSIYSLLHFKYSIPKLSGQCVKSLLRAAKKQRVIDLTKLISSDLIKVIYSVFSCLLAIITGGRKVAIWTGDFYDPVTKGDFRLGELYESFDSENVTYIEFVRDGEFGFKSFVNNLLDRKRAVIYYSAFVRILRIFKRNSYKFSESLSLEENQFIDALSYQCVSPLQIKFFGWIFKILGVSNLIAWEMSERQAPLIYAANHQRVKVIGFMHGAGMNSYMPHEFMSAMTERPVDFGIDFMGVWSEWWEQYFRGQSVFYKSFSVITPLKEARGIRNAHIPMNLKSTGNNLLWICEPLVDVCEIIDYLDIASEHFNIIFKIRKGGNDIFYKNLIKLRPKYVSFDVLDCDIFEAIKLTQLVVGSHSTAVIDASVLNVNFLLVQTKKWGNYFGMTSDFFSSSPNDFELKMKNMPKQNLCMVRKRFFGENQKIGVEWISELVR